MNKQIGRCGRVNNGGFRRSAAIAGLGILVSLTFGARADPLAPTAPPAAPPARTPTDAGRNVRDQAVEAHKAQMHEKQVVVAELPERPAAGTPAGPVDLLTFDAGKVPNRIELEAPFQLDDIAVDNPVGPLLRIGRRGPTFAGNVSHPYAEVAVADGRLTWAWKEPLSSSKQDELILAWIHFARLRLYAGRQEVGRVEFAAVHEQTVALSSLKPQPLLLGMPARFLVLKPAGALPEGWGAGGVEAPPVKQPHLMLLNSKDSLVSFTLDLDLQSGAPVTSWAQQRSNAQDRSAAALVAIDGLQQRRRELNDQLESLRKAQAGPNAGSGSLDTIRHTHTELNSIPPAIEHQLAIGKQWQQRQAMYEAVGPFDVEVAATGNGAVLYRLHVVKDADDAAASGEAAPQPPPQPGRGGAGGTTTPAAGRSNRFPSQQ